MREVFLNPDTGLLAGGKKSPGPVSRLYLELSTIDAAVSSEIGQHVLDGGFGEFVDAPCSVCTGSQTPTYTLKDYHSI